MAFNGTIDLYGAGGLPSRLCVFDDGVLVVRGNKGANIGLAFGAIGAAFARRGATAAIQQKMGAIRALGEGATSAQAAAAVDNDTHLPQEQITSVEIAKGFGKARKLVVTRTDGSKTTLRFTTREQSVDGVTRLLQPLLGPRLVTSIG